MNEENRAPEIKTQLKSWFTMLARIYSPEEVQEARQELEVEQPSYEWYKREGDWIPAEKRGDESL